MENLIVSLNVVFPLFAMMAVGFLLHHIGILDDHTADKMNKVAFKVFLPTLIFYNIYETELSEIFDGKLIHPTYRLGASHEITCPSCGQSFRDTEAPDDICPFCRKSLLD